MTAVRNPILPGCYPDPTICRVGAEYYLVTSTFEYFPGLPVFRSRDLVHWEQIGHALDRAGQLDMRGIASSGGLYAPTLRHHDGVFWLVCTLVDQQDPARGGNFVLTATDPAGPWSDPVWLDEDGIDPSLFFDDDGRVWLHGTRLAREPQWRDQTEVWLRELDPAAMRLTGPEHVLWRGAVLGAVWAEGPHLYRVDGTYYLLAAEGGTEFHHAVSVARSESVTGPYTGNRANPVLTHRHLGRGTGVVGVGHADLVEAPDGSWWAVLLAMRPYGGYHYNLGRETFLVPVTWEDGWPVFAPGQGRVPEVVEVPSDVRVDRAGGAGSEVHGPDGAPSPAGPASQGGLVPPGDLRWTGLRGPADFADPHGDGWLLRLRPDNLTDVTTPAFLGVRQQHQDVTVRTVLRFDPAGPDEQAGLVVRQSERDHVLLLVAGRPGAAGRRVLAIHRRAGVATVLGERPLPGGDVPVTLAVRARGQDYALLVAVGDEPPATLATADGRTLDSGATGGFLGLWLGLVATSNGMPSATVAVVERFEYHPDR